MEWCGRPGHSAVLGHLHVDGNHRTPRNVDVLGEEHDVQSICISPKLCPEDVLKLYRNISLASIEGPFPKTTPTN